MKRFAAIRENRSGMSILEVLVALLIFAVAIVALTSAGVIAGTQLRMSRADVHLWAAARYKLEELTALGYDNVTAGSDTVQGYAMTWKVQGTDPKKIVLTVQAKNGKGDAVADTIVTQLADWSE